jgi:hypothetical protein
MEHPVKKIDVHEIPPVISDSGKVSLGAVSPAFPPTRGKPANATDTAKVRLGAVSPAFPPARTK